MPKTTTGLKRGFTLIEVVIAVGILSLIVGGVMASVSACLQAADVVRRERVHQGRCDALQSILQHSLMVLPPDAILRYAGSDGRNDGPPPLRLLGRQPAFAFSSDPWRPGHGCESVLSLRRESNGTLTLGGFTATNDSPAFLPPESLAANATWTPLVQNIREAKLRFFDRNQARWMDQWDREDSRPALLELGLTFADSSSSFRGIFWIPSQLNSSPAGGTNTPAPTPTPTP